MGLFDAHSRYIAPRLTAAEYMKSLIRYADAMEELDKAYRPWNRKSVAQVLAELAEREESSHSAS